jgi:hypothetical protein
MVLERITARKDTLRGYKITRQATLLRHFTIELEELSNEEVKVK